MSASESVPLKAGIGPPPTSTWCCTVAVSGFSSSRFGPTAPVVPASASAWQLPQLAVKTALRAAASPAAASVEAAAVDAAWGEAAAVEAGASVLAGAATLEAAGASVDVSSLLPPQAATPRLQTPASKVA